MGQGNILKLAFVTLLHCPLFPRPTSSYPAAFPVCIPSTCQPWIFVYVSYLSFFLSVCLTLECDHWPRSSTKCPSHAENIPSEFKPQQTHLASCLPFSSPSPSTASTAPFSIWVKGLLTETCTVHSFFNRMLFPPSICRIWETLWEKMTL